MTPAEQEDVIQRLAQHLVDSAKAWTDENMAALIEADPELVMVLNVRAAEATHHGMVMALADHFVGRFG